MVIIDLNRFRYVGRRDGLYYFINAVKREDPFIICLNECIAENRHTNERIIFNPDTDISSNLYTYDYHGFDSNDKEYHIPITLNNDSTSSMRVKELIRRESNPKRKLARYRNLVNERLAIRNVYD